MPRHKALQGIYLALGTNPVEDSCFSIYQNNGIKMYFIFKKTIQRKPFFYFYNFLSTNSLGYCELREPIKAHKNDY